MSLNEARDVHVRNNIFFSAKGQNPVDMKISSPCDCTLESNIYFNGSNGPVGLKGAGDVMADPLSMKADPTDRAGG